MAYMQRDRGFGGPRKSYGGKKPYGGRGRGGFGGRDAGERAEMHDAVCSQCGKDCQVPFRPNGSKPVLCRDCFRGSEGGAPSSAPRYGARTERPERTAGPSVDTQLREINNKLDYIIKSLEE